MQRYATGIRVLYYASFTNLYHFQLCWIMEDLDTFSITVNSHNCLNRLILTYFHIFANRSNFAVKTYKLIARLLTMYFSSVFGDHALTN